MDHFDIPAEASARKIPGAEINDAGTELIYLLSEMIQAAGT